MIIIVGEEGLYECEDNVRQLNQRFRHLLFFFFFFEKVICAFNLPIRREIQKFPEKVNIGPSYY